MRWNCRSRWIFPRSGSCSSLTRKARDLMSAVVDQSPNTAAPNAVEAPRDELPKAPVVQPVVFIVEEELGNANTLLTIASTCGVRCEVLVSCAALIDAMGRTT